VLQILLMVFVATFCAIFSLQPGRHLAPEYLLFVTLCAIVPAVVYLFCAIKNRRRAQLIEGTPVTEARQLDTGLTKVRGKAVALGPVLESPLSGTPCVHYRFKVEYYVKAGGRSAGGWRVALDDVQNIPCGVVDGTGIASVRLDQAHLVLRGPTNYYRPRDNPSQDLLPETQSLRERYPGASWWNHCDGDTRYTETLIAEGDELLVVGTVQTISGGNWQFEKGDAPFIVSNVTEDGLVASYRRKARNCWLLAALILAAGGGVLATAW
jgi:hypothetical protein